MSLPEQKSAIERFAAQFGLNVATWFEERETAAKRGRPVWNVMLKELRKGTFQGVVIHKIDRSARNLRDWADLGELIDQGIEVRFANESLDMQSRGGRLSADIQAVVAADYIRNLREEAKKGLYGRLKQGFYPWRAPIGYLDNGSAKPKTVDPVKGPLIRQAFALYATGQWSIPRLVEEMERRGLRNLGGGNVTKNGMHTILRNPFYTGLMRIIVAGETCEGNHEALISRSQFQRVQDILHGRVGTRVVVNDFLFRRTIKCGNCGYSLIGERQKGIVYYRCHKPTCRKILIREDAFAAALDEQLKAIEFSEGEKAYLRDRLQALRSSWAEDRQNVINAAMLRIEKVTERLNRLTDAYLDQALDKAMFEERKASLLGERMALEAKIQEYEGNRRSLPEEIEKCVELAGNANCLYRNASVEKKRRLFRILMSNCTLRDKRLDFAWQTPFRIIAAREKSDECRERKEIGRTVDLLVNSLTQALEQNSLADMITADDLA